MLSQPGIRGDNIEVGVLRPLKDVQECADWPCCEVQEVLLSHVW